MNDRNQIAPTAMVDPTAQLGSDIQIGSGSVIGPGVTIGDGCRIGSHVIIVRGTTLGRNNRIFHGCILGEEPQMLHGCDPETRLEIGEGNVIREYVTIHRGTPEGAGVTRIGNGNFFMVGSHLGHDCIVEDHVVLTNSCHIGGHGKLERRAWLSGGVMTHQFVTIGCFAYVAGQSAVSHDIPPFVRVSGSYPCEVRGINSVGLQRGGLTEASIQTLLRLYRQLYRKRQGRSILTLVQELLNDNQWDEHARYLLESIQRSGEHRMGRYREQFRH